MTNAFAERQAAEKELEAAFAEVFENLALIPQNKVADVHSVTEKPDGLLILLDTEDGGTIIIAVQKGKPVAVQLAD